MTGAAVQIAERNIWTHRPYRVAMRRQSLSWTTGPPPCDIVYRALSRGDMVSACCSGCRGPRAPAGRRQVRQCPDSLRLRVQVGWSGIARPSARA
ncbi:hypothetical protein EXZ48_29560 [Shinella sp. JR1-6]|nr:hypothetical protein EXZ48_29560 [Shinella sp. JR1-6]